MILFDLDDTLFRHSESVAIGVLAHRRAHSGPMAEADDTVEFLRWQQLEEHHYHRYLAGEIGFAEQRRARARGFVEPYGLDLADDDVADLWFESYLREYRRGWMLHDDALPALDELVRSDPDVRFGIVTNAETRFQMQKLEAMELSGRVDHVVASGDLGFAKPDARIFVHACRLFGVDPEDAMYVGDRLETDAIGASAAGLTGVWLLRGRSPSPDEAAAAAASGVHVIQTLAVLPALVNS